jgi:outer membrane protein assembly factor BamB
MRELMAFDTKTGRELWRTPTVGPTGMNPEGYFHGSFSRARFGDVETVIPANGTIVRAADGKVLFRDARLASKQNVSSPVIHQGILSMMATLGETLYIVRLPETAAEKMTPEFTAEVKLPTKQFPQFYLGWHTASPLVHDGLIYLMNCAGVLTVVDEKAGAIVYQRLLDLDHFETPNEGPARGHGISPVLAGKHIYFFGNSGAAVVIEPGREFKQVAKNKIEGLSVPGTWGERQDRAVAGPFVDAGRIYYRTESAIYAIEAKP